jgi:hypothetical protein
MIPQMVLLIVLEQWWQDREERLRDEKWHTL